MEKIDEEDTRQNKQRKQFRRFEASCYLEEYIPAYYQDYADKVHECYQVIESYKKHSKEAYWAKCCRTFIRNVGLEKLNHPRDQLQHVKQFIVVEKIHKEKDLMKYCLDNMPTDADGNVLVPQINMKHPELHVKREGHSDLSQPSYRMKEEEPPAKLPPSHEEHFHINEEFKSDQFLGKRVTDLEAKAVHHSEQIVELNKKADKDKVIRETFFGRVRQLQEDIDALKKERETEVLQYQFVVNMLDDKEKLIEELKQQVAELAFKVQVLSDDKTVYKGKAAKENFGGNAAPLPSIGDRINAMVQSNKRFLR